jgi:hypothetical protein
MIRTLTAIYFSRCRQQMSVNHTAQQTCNCRKQTLVHAFLLQDTLPMHRQSAGLRKPCSRSTGHHACHVGACQSRASSPHAWRSQSAFACRASSGSHNRHAPDVTAHVLVRAVQSAELACVLAAIVLQAKASMSSSSTAAQQQRQETAEQACSVAVPDEEQQLILHQPHVEVVSTPAAHSHGPGILLAIALLCNISLRSLTNRLVSAPRLLAPHVHFLQAEEVRAMCSAAWACLQAAPAGMPRSADGAITA